MSNLSKYFIVMVTTFLWHPSNYKYYLVMVTFYDIQVIIGNQVLLISL